MSGLRHVGQRYVSPMQCQSPENSQEVCEPPRSISRPNLAVKPQGNSFTNVKPRVTAAILETAVVSTHACKAAQGREETTGLLRAEVSSRIRYDADAWQRHPMYPSSPTVTA